MLIAAAARPIMRLVVSTLLRNCTHSTGSLQNVSLLILRSCKFAFTAASQLTPTAIMDIRFIGFRGSK